MAERRRRTRVGGRDQDDRLVEDGGPDPGGAARRGEALAKKHGCLFAATSSKDNKNVVAAFRALCSKVLESQERMESIKEEAIVSLTAGKPRCARRPPAATAVSVSAVPSRVKYFAYNCSTNWQGPVQVVVPLLLLGVAKA